MEERPPEPEHGTAVLRAEVAPKKASEEVVEANYVGVNRHARQCRRARRDGPRRRSAAGRREARTQGAPILERIGATEDAASRRSGAPSAAQSLFRQALLAQTRLETVTRPRAAGSTVEGWTNRESCSSASSGSRHSTAGARPLPSSSRSFARCSRRRRGGRAAKGVRPERAPSSTSATRSFLRKIETRSRAFRTHTSPEGGGCAAVSFSPSAVSA